MSYKLKKFKSKNTHWIIIDLYNIYKKEYDFLKNKSLNTEAFIKTLFIKIKNKILYLTNLNNTDDNNKLEVVLINQIKINNDNDICIWRKNIIPNWDDKFNTEYYKYCNDAIYNSLYDNELCDFIKDNHFIYLNYNFNFIEINDVISIITKTIEYNYMDDMITIISSDTDFYQLINDKITVLNMNGNEDISRILSSGEINLWYKIINGNKKNNIPIIKFNSYFIDKFIKLHDNDNDNEKDKDNNNNNEIENNNQNNYNDHNNMEDNDDIDNYINYTIKYINNIENESDYNENDYRELTKRELYYFLHHLNSLKKILENNPNYVLNKQHLINKSLIDFSNIPIEFVNMIEKDFWEIYKKNKNLFYRDRDFNDKDLYRNEKNDKKTKKDKTKKDNYNNRFNGLEIEDNE